MSNRIVQISLGGTGVLNENGDLIYFDSDEKALSIGTDGQLLGVVSGLPAWVDAATGSSPLTTDGDIYFYNGGNDRLPIGTANQVLSVNSGGTQVEWVDNSGSEYTNTDDTNGRLRKYILPSTFDFTNIPANYDNAIWEIRFIYDLGGASITIPNNVTLEFNGGRINNGNITVAETEIVGTLAGFGSDIIFAGTFKGELLHFDWFDCERLDEADYDTFINGTNATYGAIPTISTTNRIILQQLIDDQITVKFGQGIYPFDDAMVFTNSSAFRLIGEARERTLLFSPNGHFIHMTSGGATSPYLRELSIECNGSIMLTDAWNVNAVHGLVVETCDMISYNDHVFHNDKSTSGGTGCPIYGTKFENCTISGGAAKSSFYFWGSGSNIFDNVVDAFQFFNGVSRWPKGTPKAIWWNSNVKKYCNSNISYSGFDYVSYIDEDGLYYFNAYDNVFETGTYSYQAIVKVEASPIVNLFLSTLRNKYINDPKETGFHYIVPVNNLYIDNGTDSPTPLYCNNVRNNSGEFIRAITTNVDSGSTKYRLAYYEPHSQNGTDAGPSNILTPTQDLANFVGMGSYFADDSANISFIQIRATFRNMNTGDLSRGYGETGDEPTEMLYTGKRYFNTTLDKPMWYNGTTWIDAGSGSASVLTTAGDLLTYGTSDERLGIGTANQVLTVNAGATAVEWTDASSGSSPLTTKGDLYIYDTDNERLPIGSEGQILVVSASGLPSWENAEASTLALVSTQTTNFNAGADHVGGMNEFDSVSDSVVTVQGYAVEAIPVESVISYRQESSGTLTVAYSGAASGNSATTQGVGDVITLWHKTQDNWVVIRTPKSKLEVISIGTSDLVTDLTTGTSLGYFNMPYGFEIIEVRESLLTVDASAGITVDINVNGSSILSTLLTTDANENDSDSASVPAVISTSTLSKGDVITINHDVVGTGQKGAVTQIIGYRII